jgi:hypothetical protein
MVVRFLATKVLPSVTVGAAVTVYCTNAQAFFPPIPTTNTVVTTPPVAPIVPVVPPPVVPVTPPFVPPPAPVRPKPHCNPDPHAPCCVPEPATVLSGLMGLSLIGAAALKRKFGKK